MDSKLDDEYSQKLMEELPRIDTAVRNFLTMQLTNSHLYSGATVISGERNSLTNEHISALAKQADDALGPKEIQLICGSILRQCNSIDLLHPVDWSKRFPQGKKQLGLERIDQITQYKVKYQLWKFIRSRNEKVTKNFGLTMLKLMWEEVKKSALREATEKRVGDRDQIMRILDTFEQSWKGDDQDLSELVWAADFASTLRDRHFRRETRASQRLKELEREQRDIEVAD